MIKTEIPNTFFETNRRALLAKMESSSIAFLSAAEPMVRGADARFPYRQDADFFYFTGIEYPDCRLMFVPDNDGKPEEYLFIPRVDPEKEKWEGKMLTKEIASEISGIKNVEFNEHFLPLFYRYQKWRDTLYCQVNDVFYNQALTNQHQLLADIRVRLPGLQLKKLNHLSVPLRIHKKTEEIDQLRKSIAIIEKALKYAAPKIKPGKTEYQIEAEITYQYIYHGCRRIGFDLIAAGGVNATCLHYIENNCVLNDGELLLIDTGGEYGMHSGDITRTFPINGKFTEKQAKYYQAVLEVQEAFIHRLKPGKTWSQLYKIAGEISGEIYKKYGFIDKPEDHPTVGYHSIGHNLGLDVHDVTHAQTPLKEGAVITVEPGIYLPEEKIGIRIEDDILITRKGCENLSQSIPKSISDIENMMQ